MCPRGRHGPEGTALFYEAPKGELEQVEIRSWVPGLWDTCPITRLYSLTLPICEGSRQVAQLLPTPASPTPSSLGLS